MNALVFYSVCSDDWDSMDGMVHNGQLNRQFRDSLKNESKNLEDCLVIGDCFSWEWATTWWISSDILIFVLFSVYLTSETMYLLLYVPSVCLPCCEE